MKKLVVILSSALPESGGYEKVGGSGGRSKLGKCPKWEFDKQQVFEGLFVSSREQNGDNGAYMVYEVLHKVTMKPFVMFGSMVLDENMSKVKPLSLIMVEYKGKPKGKKYKMFDVAVNPTYVFDPADWEKAGFDLVGDKTPAQEYESPVSEETTATPPARNFAKKPADNVTGSASPTNKPKFEEEEPPF